MKIKLAVTIICFGYCTTAWGQYGFNGSEAADTIHYTSSKDTVKQRDLRKDIAEDKLTEGDVKQTVKGNGFTRWLSSSILKKDTNIGAIDSLILEDYSGYNGKIIRNVNVVGLGPYEVSEFYPDEDEQNWLTKVGEATHANTRGFVLRNNLMVKEGDVFDNDMIINNLAYYRSLRYIYDAKVLITPVSNSSYVDIEFVVRDVWSIGISIDKVDFNELDFEIYDWNILGFGSELRAGVFYDRAKGNDYLGFRLLHSEENTKGSFFSRKVEWVNRRDKTLRHASAERKVLPNLRTVGGASYEYLDENYYFITIDTIHQVKKETADVWLGQVFNIGEKGAWRQDRLAFLVRYEYRNPRNKMPIQQPYYSVYEDRNLYIASLSLFRQRYNTDRLLFGFGIYENIPRGYNITLQAGYEDHRYNHRFYTSLSAKLGRQYDWGYTYINGVVGGYVHGGSLKNGMVEANMAYFSPLVFIRNQAYRQFAYISYARGIRRGAGEGNFMNYTEDLLFDMSNDDRRYYGNTRLSISLESDFFSTVRLFGFRFVFFNFADLTWLGNKTAIFSNDFLPGVGLGVRIRNDKLVFKTLQIKIGWYPKFPQNGLGDYYDLSGVDRFLTNDFVPQKPQTLEFK